LPSQFKSIDGIASDTTVQTVLVGVTNEYMIIKRLKILNHLADAGATITYRLWKGTTQSSATMEDRDVPLAPGQKKEYDPTMMVLESGESLYFQASAVGLNISGDYLRVY
jgi:hypothetical protein